MRKMIFFLWVFFLSPSITWTQEKVEAPAWNVGDKWVFTQGNIEVIGADKKSYALKFSKDICILEHAGFEVIIFEKSTLNRVYTVREDKREKYTEGRRRILNFPLNPGKQWEDTFAAMPSAIVAAPSTRKYFESFMVLGLEDVEVRAGKFKAIKLEHFVKGGLDGSGKTFYWYSPDAKYFVKCLYDKDYYRGVVDDWELVSFILKK